MPAPGQASTLPVTDTASHPSHYKRHSWHAQHTGLIVVFSFFMSKEELFKSEGKFKWISQSMQYVGRHTLDIYLLHYFFLPTLPVLAGVVRGGAVIELSVTLIISIIIIMKNTKEL